MSNPVNPADNYPTEDDEFTLESGIKSDYDGVVLDGWFGTREQTGNALNLFLKIKADDGEEVERRYSCGDDWASFDGGKTAEHPSKTHFNNNSNIGRLVSAVMSIAEAEVRARSAELNKLGPRHAGLLVGFKFHWEAFEDSFTPRATESEPEPKKQEFFRVLPTAFLGIEGTSNPTAATAQEAAPAATAAGTETAGGEAAAGNAPGDSGPLSTVDPSTAAQIKVLAKSKTYPEWVDAVMGLTGVIENATLMVALGDEAFYTTLKEG